MEWSKFFLPTLKEAPAAAEAESHRLMLRAGLVHMLTAGVYSYLPLGWRALRRCQTIIEQEMDAAGAHQLLLPALQPLELWQKTGRDEVLGRVMIRFKDTRDRWMCLGPTHEEVITALVRSYVRSYRQLPVTLYQIQTKFRDELRPRFGLMRACEFIMKDAYSFDQDEEGLQRSYETMLAAYHRIFERCDLPVVVREADTGMMGGRMSHEFLVPCPIGEDEIVVCRQCGQAGMCGCPCSNCGADDWRVNKAVELGHVFQLGTKYSGALEAYYLDANDQRRPMQMGCYGIGVSRMLATIIEVHHDDKGICWPKEVAPFDVLILMLKPGDEMTQSVARRLEDALKQEGYAVLIDDRDVSPGVKFNDADLIGLPWRVVLGPKRLNQGQIEVVSRRNTSDAKVLRIEEAAQHITTLLNNSCGEP